MTAFGHFSHNNMAHGTLLTSVYDILAAEVDIIGQEDNVPFARTIGDISGPGSFTVRLKGKQPGVFLLLGTTV